ncbi:hypothetical protein KKD37_04720 [Patescibacteria group bacterium]|nr:hypothetical protein [Patescibacteria group bacterium]
MQRRVKLPFEPPPWLTPNAFDEAGVAAKLCDYINEKPPTDEVVKSARETRKRANTALQVI